VRAGAQSAIGFTLPVAFVWIMAGQASCPPCVLYQKILADHVLGLHMRIVARCALDVPPISRTAPLGRRFCGFRQRGRQVDIVFSGATS